MFFKAKGISHLGQELATAGETGAKRLKGTQMLELASQSEDSGP
jgi:hypothetical protein